jgi:hypothetical protein
VPDILIVANHAAAKRFAAHSGFGERRLLTRACIGADDRHRWRIDPSICVMRSSNSTA